MNRFIHRTAPMSQPLCPEPALKTNFLSRSSAGRSSAVRVSALLLGAVLVSASPALAQMSEAEVKAEIAFARGLASEWSFVGLAEGVLTDVRSQAVTSGAREQLALVTCEVYSIGARHERDVTRRNELFERALSEYTDFVANNPTSDYRPTAEAALVDTSSTYARALDAALEEAVGEEAEALSERKVSVLTDAVKLTQDLISAIKQIPSDERKAQQQTELQGLMLNRGVMLGEIGRSSDDGTYFFSQALQALENMVFEFGEGTPPALLAYNALGEVYMHMDDPENASWMFEGVINQAWPADPQLMKDLVESNGGDFDPDQIAFRYLFMERSMEGLLEAYMARGETGDACAYAMHYYNTQRLEGLNFSPTGYQSLLAVARTLLEAGGYVGGNLSAGQARWFATQEEMEDEYRSKRMQTTAVDFALKLANQVNDENKGNILQVRAQKLISEISNRPGVVVSPEILLQAAQGEYYAQNFDAAIEGLHKVMRALETREPSERLEYGARTMSFLANSLRLDGRELEAAMAFREGVTRWQGDPEYDTKNAQGYQAMIKKISQASPGDDVLTAMLDEADDLVVRFGDEAKADAIHWKKGMRLYSAKDWDGAIVHFEKIEADADYYEKAVVQIAVCQVRGGRQTPALVAFDEYLDTYILDPAHELRSETRKARRKEAMAAAEFFRGLILFQRAEKDPSLYQRVTDLLTGYDQRYPTQDILAPWTLQMVMQSRLKTGNRSGAREVIDVLIKDWPDHKRTAQGSKQFYKALKAIREDANTGADEKRTLLGEMAQFLRLGNDVGTSDFTSLRNESLHWMELGEFGEGERVLAKLSQRYGGEADRQDDMRRYVLPDLGRALMQNGKVADAKDILTPLVLDEGSRPAKNTVLTWAKSVTGWLTGEGTQVQEVAGAGGTDEEWAAVIDKLDRITKAGDKWQSGEWYEQKLMIVYAYYAWSQDDQRKRESAQSQLKGLDIQLQDPSYAVVNRYCEPPEEEDPAVAARLGGGVLQSRYQYMARKLR